MGVNKRVKILFSTLQILGGIDSIVLRFVMHRHAAIQEMGAAGELDQWQSYYGVCFYFVFLLWLAAILVVVAGVRLGIFSASLEKWIYILSSLFFVPGVYFVLQLFFPITLQ